MDKEQLKRQIQYAERDEKLNKGIALAKCPICGGNCEEEIGVKEPISKTFPRVNEFENDNSYRR